MPATLKDLEAQLIALDQRLKDLHASLYQQAGADPIMSLQAPDGRHWRVTASLHGVLQWAASAYELMPSGAIGRIVATTTYPSVAEAFAAALHEILD